MMQSFRLVSIEGEDFIKIVEDFLLLSSNWRRELKEIEESPNQKKKEEYGSQEGSSIKV